MSTEEPTPSADSTERPSAHSAGPSRRSLRVMAVVRWMLLAFVTIAAASNVWTYWGPKHGEHPTRRENRYYCPMHPQILSPDPGECPICHMTLELIPADRRTPNSDAGVDSSTDGPQRGATPPSVTTVTVSEDRQRSVGVATSLVVREQLADRLRVPGSISARESGISQARVRSAGFVEQVSVSQTGVRVSRGQPLAYVYSPEIYRAQEEFLTSQRWSRDDSRDSSVAGGSDIATPARRALELLGLSERDIETIARTGRPIRAIAVRAPASGFVTRFNAVLGARAEPEMVLYEIADLSTVWFVASVHERDVNTIRIGMTARLTASGGGSALDGRVDLIEPLVDPSTRTARVRLVVANREGLLRPGQFGEAEFERTASAGLFVPRDAVIHAGEHDYVYVATSGDRFDPHVVRTGLARGDRIQVLEGVAEGDRVVSRGSFMLDSESRLQASLADSPSATTARGTGSTELGPSCESEFDRVTQPNKYTQCRACERQHAGMGSMVADCKNAIARPWR